MTAAVSPQQQQQHEALPFQDAGLLPPPPDASMPLVVALRIQEDATSSSEACLSVSDSDSGSVLFREDENEAPVSFGGFNHILKSSSSGPGSSLYPGVVKDFVPLILDGYDLSLVSTGGAGTSKTQSLVGNDQGVLRQCVEDLFLELSRGCGVEAAENTVRVSYLDIDNDRVRDLLSDNGLNVLRAEETAVFDCYGRLTDRIVDRSRW